MSDDHLTNNPANRLSEPHIRRAEDLTVASDVPAIRTVPALEGTVVRNNLKFPVAAMICLLAALGFFVGAAVFQTIHLVCVALPFALLALSFFLVRERPFEMVLGGHEMDVKGGSGAIPYSSLQGVLAPGRPQDPGKKGPRSYPILVLHSEGVFRIPGRLNIPSDELYRFLHGQFSLSGSRSANSKLQEFVQRQESEHGAEWVWTYQARKHLGPKAAWRITKPFWLTMLVTAGTWIILGASQANHAIGWAIAGAFLLPISFIILLGLWITNSVRRESKWRQSSLVIAPGGLAMMQGSLQGHLRWSELKDAKLQTEVNWARISLVQNEYSQPSILLVVEGAKLRINDIYDRPLPLIFDRIKFYWT